jgi:hypothetical protein
MSAVPAARYLADFGVGASVAGAQRGSGEAADHVDTAASQDQAFARGVEAGRAAACAEFEAKLAEQRNLATRHLAAERQAWAGGIGKKLASGLLVGLQDLEARIADSVARILKPFVAAELHAQAIAELKAGLDALVSTDQGGGIQVSGPADVLEVMQGRLAGKNVAVAFTPSEDCDVRIVAGQATLETRLGEWMAKLDETVR